LIYLYICLFSYLYLFIYLLFSLCAENHTINLGKRCKQSNKSSRPHFSWLPCTFHVIFTRIQACGMRCRLQCCQRTSVFQWPFPMHPWCTVPDVLLAVDRFQPDALCRTNTQPFCTVQNNLSKQFKFAIADCQESDDFYKEVKSRFMTSLTGSAIIVSVLYRCLYLIYLSTNLHRSLWEFQSEH